jgi:hypothetical protein
VHDFSLRFGFAQQPLEVPADFFDVLAKRGVRRIGIQAQLELLQTEFLNARLRFSRWFGFARMRDHDPEAAAVYVVQVHIDDFHVVFGE